MQNTFGVILAAGRGSRMKGFTAHKPKCLLELAHKPLLQWQMEALRKAGIQNILVLRGYQAHALTPQALPWGAPFLVADNPLWESSQMVYTLWCADSMVRQAFAQGATHILISYSDIVYHFQHIIDLCHSTQDISITYDTAWEELWRLRFEDPLSDAESFLQNNGLLCDIGKKVQNYQDIQGQYMGLLRFSLAGWEKFCQLCQALGEQVKSTDMTSLLQLFLTQNMPIGAMPVKGKWCEADNQHDLHVYEKMLQQSQQGHWLHDWR